MIAKGILPTGTELTPINPMPEGRFTPADAVRPWASLSAEEKRLFCRMAEVYAGFSEYTDMQVGRIVEYLEESGQLENTLILWFCTTICKSVHSTRLSGKRRIRSSWRPSAAPLAADNSCLDNRGRGAAEL